MTNTYNTGNPLGSTAAKDLFDNASNFDEAMNSTSPAFYDRLGFRRETWAGMEVAFDQSLAAQDAKFQETLNSLGYIYAGEYAAALVLPGRNYYVAVSAATTGSAAGYFRPSASAPVPLVLTGVWATDAPELVLIGDDVLRDELADSDGATMIGYLNGTVARKLEEIVSIVDFGATDGEFVDSSAAFIAAEASTVNEIYIPQGIWNAQSTALTKKYYGHGKILQDGVYIGGDYSRIATLPARGSHPADFYGGDTSHVNPEQFIIDSTVNRESLTTPYYDYPLIQHFNRATFKSGHSGYDSALSQATIIGTNYCKVIDALPFSVGMEVVIGSYLPNAEIKTITAINIGTGTITFDSNFASVIGSNTENNIASVSRSRRTHTSINQTEMDVLGAGVGGDFIAHSSRIACGSTHNIGRNHAFDRTTIGFSGGDAVAYKDGIYIAGHEFMYYDAAAPTGAPESGNIFVIDTVRSFYRTRDDGTFGCVWLGTLYKSEGSLPANAAHVVSGKWKRALDTVLADLGATQAAVSMAANQRIYWGSQASYDVDGFRFWGDTLGTIYNTGYNDGASNLWEVNVDGVPVLRARSTGVSVAGTLTSSASLISGDNISINAGKKMLLNGSSGNTYLVADTLHIYAVINGGTPIVIA